MSFYIVILNILLSTYYVYSIPIENSEEYLKDEMKPITFGNSFKSFDLVEKSAIEDQSSSENSMETEGEIIIDEEKDYSQNPVEIEEEKYPIENQFSVEDQQMILNDPNEKQTPVDSENPKEIKKKDEILDESVVYKNHSNVTKIEFYFPERDDVEIIENSEQVHLKEWKFIYNYMKRMFLDFWYTEVFPYEIASVEKLISNGIHRYEIGNSRYPFYFNEQIFRRIFNHHIKSFYRIRNRHVIGSIKNFDYNVFEKRRNFVPYIYKNRKI